ncbi:family 10 glycosylhydrolase [Coleofasciculus sp. FACHB-64]|uniref:family 10 glycosylhydrolase n=1 Tax=Cyanophyceae TaxID=3028117 RepID=UPI0016838516|nr:MULTISPECIES: family 10 glycosylhydrolase [unclassified Coleofasciculus]MBD1840844.1 family 10 glycosylhydrolase [Coleofasciculus sp. FACHB-501]MBD2047192.1 family 10 glycosylhydrolase [Coleofasciculus sp. FACHB-64]
MPPKKENNGCGCASIPFSLIIVLFGVGYWGFRQLDRLNISQFLPNNQQNNQQPTTPILTPAPSQGVTVVKSPLPQAIPTGTPTTKPQVIPLPVTNSPLSQATPAGTPITKPQVSALPVTPKNSPSPQNPWEKKKIRGIYLSRYQVTNNANERTIRERVRYYRSQGINTIIHGVWGNGCTMYNSEVMQQTLGYKSCPNQFQDRWLDWLIDEAHKQGMQVHAYFEKGIKIDKNSPIFDLAISKRWIVPGVDKTYAGIDHYLLDVELPEVANFFKKISVEFVKKYPHIDAVQWDDYLGYHAELPGKVDRTAHLTNFVRQMRADMKKANPTVSFDLCHHNPYWGKRYFAADWQNWNIDRVFIQIYNDANFNQELDYAEKYEGVAISDKQLYRLKELVNNPKIKSILVFPSSGKPEETAALLKNAIPVTK